ncbi:MAG: NAD(P)/FAD-dependent oxidoreductase [Elusimicrobiota bacterium]
MTTKKNNFSADIIVVGGGPAGMMAAGRAGELGATVTLLEKTYRMGAKLLLTGGGRCNISNSAGLTEFIKAFGQNGPFLYRAFHVFFNQDLINFFSARGLETRQEPDGKIFPVNDNAESVLTVLRKYIEENNGRIFHNKEVREILLASGEKTKVIGVKMVDGEMLKTGKVIIAAGGMSYPKTGSAGDGYKLAQQCGHTITPLRPGLTALESDETFIKELPGLTLKDIIISIVIEGKVKLSEKGDLLFTHTGVSGPKVLVFSGMVVDALTAGQNVALSLQLRPDYTVEEFDRYLQRELESFGARTFRDYLENVLPGSLVPVFGRRCAVPPDQRCSMINRSERKIIAGMFMDFRIPISKPRPIEEATVTRGGVALEEINPQSMESRLVDGLYFCGEVLDIDGITGGYNLQEAFSSGYLAGESAAGKK